MAKRKAIQKKSTTVRKTKKTSKYKRTAKQVAEDRAMAFQMYNNHYTQQAIADHIAEIRNNEYTLTRQQIALDLKAAKTEAVKRFMDDGREIYIVQQMKKIDMLEQEAWNEWARSKKDFQEQHTVKKNGNRPTKIIIEDKEGEKEVMMADYDYQETKRVQRQQLAAVEYLKVIQWCITERNKLLSLYSVEIKKPDGSSGGKVEHSGVLIYLPENGRG